MPIISSIILWLISAGLALAGTGVSPAQVSSGAASDLPSFGEYFHNLFPIMIQIIASLAILYIAYWGLMYMLSNIPGIKKEGSERIWSALGGLVLALAAYLILQTINPDITTSITNSPFLNK